MSLQLSSAMWAKTWRCPRSLLRCKRPAVSCYPQSWRRREQAHTYKAIATNFQLGSSTGAELPFTDIAYNTIAYIRYAVKTNLCIQYICYISLRTDIYFYIWHIEKGCSVGKPGNKYKWDTDRFSSQKHELPLQPTGPLGAWPYLHLR